MMKKNKKYKLFWNGSKSYVVRKQKDFKWLVNTLKMDYPGLKMPPLVGKSSRTLKVHSNNPGFHKHKPQPKSVKRLILLKEKAVNFGNSLNKRNLSMSWFKMRIFRSQTRYSSSWISPIR